MEKTAMHVALTELRDMSRSSISVARAHKDLFERFGNDGMKNRTWQTAVNIYYLPALLSADFHLLFSVLLKHNVHAEIAIPAYVHSVLKSYEIIPPQLVGHEN